MRPLADLIVSPTGRRLAGHAGWALAGACAARGLQFVAFIFLARLIGKQQFGQLGIIQSTVGLFGVLAGFGIGMTATKYVAEHRVNQPDKAGRIAVLTLLATNLCSIVAGATLAGLAPLMAAFMGGEANMVPALRVAALFMVLIAVTTAQAGVLAGFEAYKPMAKASAVGAVAAFVGTVVGALMGGLTGALWGMTAGQMATWAAQRVAIVNATRFHGVPLSGWRAAWRERSVLWRFSLPSVLGGAMVSPAQWLCSTLMVRHVGGFAEMGVFSAANQIYLAVLFLPGAITTPLLPVLAERFGRDNGAKAVWSALTHSIAACGLIVLPLTVAGCVLSRWIMGLYGNAFVSGWSTLCMVLGTALLVALMQPIGYALAALGRVWAGMIMSLGWAVVFIVLTVMLAGHGAFGLASARLLAYVAHGAWVFVFVAVVLRSKPLTHL